MSKKMTIVEHSYLSVKIAESDLTLKDFAERFGVCRSTVYKWIRDIDTITLNDAKRLANYLSCPLDKLLELDVDSSIFVGVDSKKGGEISLDDIVNKTFQPPRETLKFTVDEFWTHRGELYSVGGIYTFTHETEGWLYVGVSKVLGNRLENHLNGTGNKSLFKKIGELDDVIVTIYRETNASVRELCESIFILKHNPRFNILKKYGEYEGSVEGQSKYSKIQEDQAVQMYVEGETYSTISHTVGVSQPMIGKILRKRGVPLNRDTKPRKVRGRETLSQPARELRRGKVAHLYRKGWKRSEIAEHLNLTPDRVSKIYRQYLDRQEATK